MSTTSASSMPMQKEILSHRYAAPKLDAPYEEDPEGHELDQYSPAIGAGKHPYTRIQDQDHDITPVGKPGSLGTSGESNSRPRPVASNGFKFRTFSFLRPSKHPFSPSHEPPDWLIILIHICLCLLVTPILMIFVALAQNRSLFWARLVVACGCALIGATLGITLLSLGQRLIEAIAWTTIIQQSSPSLSGVALRDVASTTRSSTALLTVYHIFRTRLAYNWVSRRQESQWWWFLYVFYGLVIIITSTSLAFLLGRIVDITASIQSQDSEYYEVPIRGALSDADIASGRALTQSTLNSFLTWTLFPLSSAGTTPSTTVLSWGADRVYFYDNISPTLLSASGNCVSLATITRPEIGVLNSTATLLVNSRDGNSDPGMILRFPKWGMRIHCAKETHPFAIIPRSNLSYTYLFTHKDTLSELFRSIDMDVPDFLNGNLSESSLQSLDSIEDPVDYSAFATVAPYGDTGDTVSFGYTPVYLGPNGAIRLETILVRLNTTFAPNGEFFTYGDVVPGSQGSRIGYDAVVCLHAYEPWIVEARNSSVSSGLIRLVGKGSEVVDGDRQKEKLLGSSANSALRNITEKPITEVFGAARSSSSKSMAQSNSDDPMSYAYAPNSLSISFSTGDIDHKYPYLSYGRLDAKQVEQTRAMADVHNVLSYLSGCDNLVARSYPNRLLSNVRILPAFLIAFTLFVAILGVLAGLFVPKLPLGVPRRDFHAYSWAAMYVGGEMKYEPGEGKDEVFEKSMEMEEIERRFGDTRLRYVVN